MELTRIGLVLDIVGVLFLAYFGFPRSFLEAKVVEYGYEPEDLRKQRVSSWLGTALVIIGFVLQLLATCRVA